MMPGDTSTRTLPLQSPCVSFVSEGWRGLSGRAEPGLPAVEGGVTSIREGKFVVEPRFDMAYEFSEGMAEVILDKRSGYVNRAGELVVAPSFLRGQRFSEGLAAVQTGSGGAHRTVADACEIGFINATGSFVITPRFFIAGSFQGGLCLIETEKDLLYVDRSGETFWRSGWVELGGFDPYRLYPYQA